MDDVCCKNEVCCKNAVAGEKLQKLPSLEAEVEEALHKTASILKDRLESFGERKASNLSPSEVNEIQVIGRDLLNMHATLSNTRYSY